MRKMWKKGSGVARGAPHGRALSGPLRPGEVGGAALASRDPERAVRVAAEHRDHAPPPLAEELPCWAWLADGRSCLTRSGELVTAGRLSPAVTDGRSPDQIDRVLASWQRLLSGLGDETCPYLHLLRRPPVPGEGDGGAAGITALSGEKRRTFLAGRVQRLEAFVAWVHDPRPRPAAERSGSGRATRLSESWRRRTGAAGAYIASGIEPAAGRFRRRLNPRENCHDG